MKKNVFLIVTMLVIVSYARAQEQLSKKQLGDRYFERYEYFKSLGFYLKAAERNKPDNMVLERIGDCYRNTKQYEQAEEWYAKAIASPKVSKAAHYYYAEMLQRNKKFEEAKAQYKIFFAGNPVGLAAKTASCDSAEAWMKAKQLYQVKNLDSLNSAYSEWGMNYQGTRMMFASDRVNEDKTVDNRTGNYYYKTFSTGLNSDDPKQIFFISRLQEIFKDSYHIGPITMNAAADTAYVTIATGTAAKVITNDKTKAGSGKVYTRRLQIVVASREKGNWYINSAFPYSDIQKYSIGNPALSKNGRIIYFTSDMPGGEGKTDIWYCEKQKDGSWGKPKNCGKAINTKEEEDFATIGGDGAMYYSSRGLPGMGGFDVFKTLGGKDKWSIPQNLKYPINTTSDDFYLVTRDGKSGYLSSNREGGKGNDDIYSFGKVIEPPVYSLITKNDTSAIDPNAPELTKEGFVLRTIYYDLDKAEIRADAAIRLDKLALLLKQRPALRINLGSYTDARASEQYNLKLSQRRAEAAIAYLLSKGVDKSRLVENFYGKTHLVNSCGDNVTCTEAEHQLNRRTEFSVLK